MNVTVEVEDGPDVGVIVRVVGVFMLEGLGCPTRPVSSYDDDLGP